MAKYLRAFFTMILLVGFQPGISHALMMNFSDTVTSPANDFTWTHTLDITNFTPALGPGDGFEVTDADLDLFLDFQTDGTGSIKFFSINGFGDNIFLNGFNYVGSAGTKNNEPWHIDLTSASILNALNTDKNLTILLEVTQGTLKNVDSSILSGTALVTDMTPNDVLSPAPVPEPGTLLLLGSGLLVLGFVSRMRT